MKTQELADAVVHWLEYERLCGRERLLRELALVRPIHDYLASAETALIELELPIPGLPSAIQNRRGAKKCFDVVLRNPGGQGAIRDLFETKYVRGTRDFTQEFFDDLYRLEWVREPNSPNIARWFLVAGEQREINAHLVTNQVNSGPKGKRISGFDDVLSYSLSKPKKHVVVHAAVPGIREKWVKASVNVGQTDVPLTFNTELIGKAPTSPSPTNFECYIWKVSSSKNRTPKSN
jgi:hypothetical protein